MNEIRLKPEFPRQKSYARPTFYYTKYEANAMRTEELSEKQEFIFKYMFYVSISHISKKETTIAILVTKPWTQL